jgi:hypothetical protein
LRCFIHSTLLCCGKAGVLSISSSSAMQSLFQSSRCSSCGRAQNTSPSKPFVRAHQMLPNRSRSGRLHINAVASIERTLKSVSAENLSEDEIKKLLQRPRIDFTSILGTVSELQLLLLLLASGLHLLLTHTASRRHNIASAHQDQRKSIINVGMQQHRCVTFVLCLTPGGPNCGASAEGGRCSSAAVDREV